ncbi:MAG: hypothetical protein R3F43_31740 [bacterium]
MAAKDPPTAPPPGLDFAPLAAAHVDAVVALHRHLFLEKPQFCAFGAEPAWLARFHDELMRAVDGGRAAGRSRCGAARWWGTGEPTSATRRSGVTEPAWP